LYLAVSLAIGGDCLADVAVLRAKPGVFCRVVSDATVSRTVDRLARDVDRVLAALGRVRAVVQRVWKVAGEPSPAHQVTAAWPLVVDRDATLVTAHSEKERAAPTYKRATASIHCWRSPTTGRAAPVSHWPGCRGRAAPARTPPPTISG